MIRVRYGQIKIDSLSGNSSVHWGNNFIGGRVQRDKVSDALGDVQGLNNEVFGAKQLIVDSDVIDGGRIGKVIEDSDGE